MMKKTNFIPTKGMGLLLIARPYHISYYSSKDASNMKVKSSIAQEILLGKEDAFSKVVVEST